MDRVTGENTVGMLKRPRQELFVRNLIDGAKLGISQRQAYINAGYSARGDSADVQASKLVRSPKVRKRMDELVAPAVQKTRVSVESLLAELTTTIADARAAKQHSVVVNALTLSAKLVGLLKDQIEIGRPGEFSGCETPEDVIEMTRQELGEEAAHALAAMTGRAPPLTPAQRLAIMFKDSDDPRASLEFLDEMRAIVEARISETARDVAPAL